MPHEIGAKDVVYVGENETVRVLAKFDGRGKYMIHCHNLVHEDHDMMGQFEIRNDAVVAHEPFADPCLALPEGPLVTVRSVSSLPREDVATPVDPAGRGSRGAGSRCWVQRWQWCGWWWPVPSTCPRGAGPCRRVLALRLVLRGRGPRPGGPRGGAAVAAAGVGPGGGLFTAQVLG